MNINKLMKQAQKMQQEMAKAQEELNTSTFESTSGGGMVNVQVNGAKQVLDITIKPEAVDPDDVEMLQDLIIVALNDAFKSVDTETNKKMGKFSGGTGLPGLF